jgi:hypothetical protein
MHPKFQNLVLVSSLLLSSCYHVNVRGGPRNSMRPESRTAWNVMWGILDAQVDVSDCPYGMAQVTSWQPWWGFIPEIFTLGFVSPWRVDYVCSQPAAPMMSVPAYVPMPVAPTVTATPQPPQPVSALPSPASPSTQEVAPPVPSAVASPQQRGGQAVDDPESRCPASTRPAWSSASAQQKRQMMEECRGRSASQSPSGL